MGRVTIVAFALAVVAVSAALAALPGAAMAGGGPSAAKDEARKHAEAVIADLSGKLKSYLTAAIAAQGVAGAVEACRTIAPGAEAEAGEAHRAKIKRTSLRVRNPANVPDAFELKVLRIFERNLAAGDAVNTISYGEIVASPDGRRYRYMAAIPMAEQPCSACHGGRIAPDVAEKIKALYPGDQATGFGAGQIRGAFSVTVPIE